MENRCNVCGCITDLSELSDILLANEPFAVCPFCSKKIRAIEEQPSEQAKAALELLYADTKGRRGQRCSEMLFRHFHSLGINTECTPNYLPNKNVDLREEVNQLKNTVEALQNDLKKFKRRYYLSKIFGILAPVVIVFIMLVILLSSGALNAIFDYYGLISEYAGM